MDPSAVPRPLRPMAVAVAAVALLGLASACGDDESAAPTTSGAPATTVAPTTEATSVPTKPSTTMAPADAPLTPDPLEAQQWAVSRLRLPEVWSRGVRGDGVVIAVVDTGVDLTHPDLQAHLVPGRDFVDGDDRPQDENGHGTHVAGIAAAVTGNGIGVAGTAPGARIMPVRVLGADGSGSDEAIAAGIDWAVANGAGVVNLSLGESGTLARISKGGPLNTAIRAAGARGVAVVAAAGNEGATRRVYRAGVPVLVVNATDQQGALADFSNAGDLRAVAAPGVGILSTAPTGPSSIWPRGTNGYAELDGTSMAAPLVSGIAALLVARGLTGTEVLDRIAATADNPQDNPELGAGEVDPAEAAG